MTIGRPRYIPFFAEDENYPAGTDPWSGQATKYDPGIGDRIWTPATRPPAEWFNWFNNTVGRWIDYLGDVALQNWHPPAYKDTAGVTLANTEYRRDASGAPPVGGASISGPSSYWDFYRFFWVVLGDTVNDKFYKGLDGIFTEVSNGLGTGFKYSIGGHNYLTAWSYMVENTVRGAGQTTKVVITQDYSTYTLKLLPACVTEGQACDSLTTFGGRVIICGGQDGNFKIWYTDDDFATAAVGVTVGARVNAAHNLDHIRSGKNGLLIAWTQASAANGGDRIFYSTDFGITWNVRTGLAFNTIIDMTYIGDLDTYVFITASAIKTTTDPIAGAFADANTPSVPVPAFFVAIASFGSALVAVATSNTTINVFLLSWDAGQTWRTLKRCIVGSSGKARLFVNPYGQFLFTDGGSIQESFAASGLLPAGRAE